MLDLNRRGSSGRDIRFIGFILLTLNLSHLVIDAFETSLNFHIEHQRMAHKINGCL